MMKLAIALVLSGTLISIPLLAQEQKGMPMGGGGMMGKMMQMHGRMGEMEKGASGMMKGEEMKQMGQMTDCSKMTPEEMENMSKMMAEMPGMMKQMSDCMKGGMEKTK